jgi:hypothetical protein
MGPFLTTKSRRNTSVGWVAALEAPDAGDESLEPLERRAVHDGLDDVAARTANLSGGIQLTQ